MSARRAPRMVLRDAVERLTAYLASLELQLETDAALWREYRETALALAGVLASTASSNQDVELLTTAEMAARLSIAPKTLLKRKARGEIRPMLQKGKLIRWNGREQLR